MSRTTYERGRLPLAALAGVVFALTSPPFDATPCLWLGLVLFAWALGDGDSGNAIAGESKRPFEGRFRRLLDGSLRGALFGVAANLVALRFVVRTVEDFAPLPAPAGTAALLLVALAQALPWAAAGVVHRSLRSVRTPRWLAFACAVYVSTFVPSLFPWTPAGGLTAYPALLQLADVVGERGVSAIVAASAALAAATFERARSDERNGTSAAPWKRLGPFALGLAVLFVLATIGGMRMRSIEARDAALPRARVALVQPSIPARPHWEGQDSPSILARLSELTRQAEAKNVDLTIWPEASYPYVVAHASRREPIGARAILQPGVVGPVLLGLILREEASVVTNSATLVHTDGTLDAPQDKRHLLLFGERVPFAESIPWIKRTFLRGTGMRAGVGVVAFEEGAIRAAVLNCFEDTLPGAGRELGAVAPNLLVNVTNDAWFFGSAESALHERLATLRAIESRRHLVRAVNRGRATWIDARGVIVLAWPGEISGALIATPALASGDPTAYMRFGDLPTLLALMASVALFALQRRKRFVR